MRSNLSGSVPWAVLFFLCLLPLIYTENWRVTRQPRSTKAQRNKESSAFIPHVQQREEVAATEIFHSPGHQNPAKAPPVPLTEHTVSLLTSRNLDHLTKRDALRCDNGPCIDGSCCGKNGICGYGPDYCGDGCTSYCNATAMCGQYSENADMPCGMKLCCSATGWCGTTEPYCGNADPLHLTLPCQAGYGSCYVTGAPSKDPAAKSTDDRKIGYYQSWNTRNRLCNKVEPHQLNTDGYTHLYYAFATIDPTTFKIAPANPEDDARMREFTGLSASRNVKTWIAIGGFDFSDQFLDDGVTPNPTHTTWSDLVTVKEHRAVFISSVMDYMNEYGFSGVDLDWEYPGDETRGGRKLQDTRNFTVLLNEMRAEYGTSKGISLTLAPDYWYLRWFDAKAMESSVDFFGFMAYDLHGSWDADVLTLGKLVRGQADIREIGNDTAPLWFDGLDPAKINFGLAMYGRGYTLSDSSCSDLLCSFEGPSKPAPCTNSAGVMSLIEIQQLIKERNLTPKLLASSMMKQITWDDQWIGYDDEETFALKKTWADQFGFGGTMIWSIDFQEIGSGGPNGTDETVDYGPVFYVGTEVYSAPTAQCIEPCNMVFAPSTLTAATTITPGPFTTSIALGTDTMVTTQIVVTPPVITATVISFSNYHISSNQQPGATITLLPSVDLPPVTVEVTGTDSQTTSRTLILPPWPQMLSGPPDSWTTTADPSPLTFTLAPVPSESLEPWPTWDLPEFEASPVTTTTTSVTWPQITVVPVTTDVDPSQPTPPGKIRLKCSIWFFFICIKWGSIDIEMWEIEFPDIKPGALIGPGPPAVNLLKLPPGWSIRGTLPPWPKITIGPDLQPVLPADPAPCETMSAILAIETTTLATTITNGQTSVETKTVSDEFTILGCSVQDEEIATTTSVCERPTARAEPNVQGREHARDILVERAPCDPTTLDAVLYMANPKDVTGIAALRDRLTSDGSPTRPGGPLHTATVTEIKSDILQFTAFFYLEGISGDYVQTIMNSGLYESQISLVDAFFPPPPRPTKRQAEENPSNLTLSFQQSNPLVKRVGTREQRSGWGLSQVSVPPGRDWWNGEFIIDRNNFYYSYDDTGGRGQFVYIVEDKFDHSIDAFKELRENNLLDNVDLKDYGNFRDALEVSEHATQVASAAVGNLYGVSRWATLISVGAFTKPKWKLNNDPKGLKVLESFLAVADDIKNKGRIGNAVLSHSVGSAGLPKPIQKLMLSILQELDALDAVIVCAAGNDNDQSAVIDDYPALFLEEGKLNNLIVVGSAGLDSDSSYFNRKGVITTFAPGEDIPVGSYGGGSEEASGSSIATPHVAGLVAYFRGLQNSVLTEDLTKPATVVALIKKLQRPVIVKKNLNDPRLVYQTWNGIVNVFVQGERHQVSCFQYPTAPGCVPIDLSDTTPVGDLCHGNARRDLKSGDNINGTLAIRQAACPLPQNPGSPNNAPTKTLTWSSGIPSPTCSANCGKLCTGFYCSPTPTGNPPDFTPPADQPGTVFITVTPGGGTTTSVTFVTITAPEPTLEPSTTTTTLIVEPTKPAAVVPPFPAEPTKVIDIMWGDMKAGDQHKSLWLPYDVTIGKPYGTCDYGGLITAPDGITSNNIPFPGDVDFIFPLFDVDDCNYKSDGKGPGALYCGNWPPMPCRESKSAGKSIPKCIGKGTVSITPYPKVECAWSLGSLT